MKKIILLLGILMGTMSLMGCGTCNTGCDSCCGSGYSSGCCGGESYSMVSSCCGF